jgi:hypothetical protein
MATSFSLINIGAPNSNEGDTLRAAFTKINQNFDSIDNLIEEYFEEFLSTPNILPSDILPITPNTNVNISSTGTGIITLNAPTVQVSENVNIGGTLTVEDKLIALGGVELQGELEFKNVDFVDAKIDCGKF